MRQDGRSERAAPATREPDLPAAAENPQPVIDSGLAGDNRPASDNQIDNRLFVLVLQHPQERSEPRATAAVAVGALRRARLAVGLSWPNLTRALGRPDGRPADPGRWGVLYLGSARPQLLPQRPARPDATKPEVTEGGGAIIALDRHGNPLPDADRVLRGLDGLVLLDGTWSQAKTLWWRNPWLLKLHRFVLNPPQPARLGRLRREPRPEALSTLEAAALVLRHVEPDPAPADALLAALDRMIAAQSGPPRGNVDRGNVERGEFRQSGIGLLPTDRGGAGPQDRRSSSPRSRYARRSPRRRDRSATG